MDDAPSRSDSMRSAGTGGVSSRELVLGPDLLSEKDDDDDVFRPASCLGELAVASRSGLARSGCS